MIAYLNIGSNRGNRAAIIESAVSAIESALGTTARRAPIVESEPWGYDSPHPFLNLGIAIEMGDMDPEALLDILQGIERTLSSDPHRNPDGTYRDRSLDIDIIAIDDLRLSTPRLTLPHPRAHLRPFVMEPLRHLAPDTVLKLVENNR